jgi:GH24 family phage-related lysozyme (muramidase)
MKLWNQGNWSLGCERLYRTGSGKPNWSYAGGRFYRGLQNRRQDEYRLCMRDVP